MSSSFSNAQISSLDQYGKGVLLQENYLVKKGEFKFEVSRLNQKQLEAFNSFSIPNSEVEAYGNRPNIVRLPPIVSVKDGIVYEGHVDSVGKFQHGVGTQQWKNGAYYRGLWSQGIRHGKGLFVSPEGDLQVGMWDMGSLTGYGRKIWKDGDEYTGKFSNGKEEDPKGKKKWNNGDEYTGAFSQGQFTGKGRLEKDHGETIYEGEFLNGLYHGKGTFVNAEGSYKGDWELGQRNGHGIFTPKIPTAENPVYDGEWSLDQRHGNGKISYPVQVTVTKTVEGCWQNGKRIS